MNLLFRFLIIIIKCFFSKTQNILQSSVLYFRVLPHDCDINLHLTNSRYLSFMDLGRLYFLSQIKNLLKFTLKNHWTPVIAGCEISFIKPIKPLQRFSLSTRLLTWDDKYLYIEQIFQVQNQICAIAVIKGTLLYKGKPIPVANLLETIGEKIERPLPPDSVTHWLEMMKAKKKLIN